MVKIQEYKNNKIFDTTMFDKPKDLQTDTFSKYQMFVIYTSFV